MVRTALQVAGLAFLLANEEYVSLIAAALNRPAGEAEALPSKSLDEIAEAKRLKDEAEWKMVAIWSRQGRTD